MISPTAEIDLVCSTIGLYLGSGKTCWMVDVSLRPHAGRGPDTEGMASTWQTKCNLREVGGLNG